MSGRAQRLQRLLSIRQLAHDMDRSAMKTALSAVAEVEGALAALEGVERDARLAGRIALADGLRSEWMMADAHAEVSALHRQKLKKLLIVRRGLVGVAMTKFLESRREYEQLKQLVRNAEQVAHLDEARRMQVLADDWFLNKVVPEL